MRAEDVPQVAFLQVGAILDAHLLAAAGDLRVILLHDRHEPLDEGVAALENGRGQRGQPLVESAEQRFVGDAGLKQLVALQEQAVILLDVSQVRLLHLREHGVDEFAALLAGFAHHGRVGGGDHHDGQHADVLGDALVGLVVAADALLAAVLDADAEAGGGAAGQGVGAGQGEGGGAVTEVETVGGREGAFGHRQIPDRVKQIGLALAVAAADAIDVGREGELLQLDVAEVLDDDFLKRGHVLQS